MVSNTSGLTSSMADSSVTDSSTVVTTHTMAAGSTRDVKVKMMTLTDCNDKNSAHISKEVLFCYYNVCMDGARNRDDHP